jgi:hypothetical protein
MADKARSQDPSPPVPEKAAAPAPAPQPLTRRQTSDERNSKRLAAAIETQVSLKREAAERRDAKRAK